MHNTFLRTCGSALGLILISASTAQSQLPLPQASPEATVQQTVGVSNVLLTYHRPGVKGRQIWGGLIPYGEVWRAGANENTTVSFSHDVLVEGKPVPAGTYGIHMIPGETAWTVILSRNSTSWGSYYYSPSEDAARMTVSARQAEHREWLSFEFSDLTDSSAVLSLHWEKLQVPVGLKFDTPAIVIAHARDVYLRGTAGFGWQGYNQAAQYCLRKNIEMEQALAWADKAIDRQENFTTLRTKAALLDKLGRGEEAASLNTRALTLATEADINTLGYSYLTAGKFKEAIETFGKNVRNNPDSWNVYDSLAEAHEKAGNRKAAIANYEKALKLVKDAQNRKRITEMLSNLRAK